MSNTPATTIQTLNDSQRSARATEIFAVLKSRILRWEYPPGYRFTEEAICKEFEVSRSPVRETLRMLEEHHLVDKIPYRGCRVKLPNLQEIGEHYTVRLALELAVVEQLVCEGIAAALRDDLIGRWQDLDRRTYTFDAEIDGAALANLDRSFHEDLAAATGNRTLLELLCSINDRLHFVRMTDITSVERLRQTCQEHIAIVAAIAARDEAAARSAMRANIEGARAHVRSALKEVVARAYLAHEGWQASA